MHTIYEVNDTQDSVILTLNIGYGQIASTSLYLGKDLIVQKDDDIIDQSIASNSDLKGKSLNIYTTVHGINSATDQSSVAFSIKGGVKPVDWPPIIQPVSNGGVAYYSIVVNFY